MIVTARKHHSPSDTTWADVASDFAAQIAIASVVNGCLAKHAYSGCPSGSFGIAAMNGTLFSGAAARSCRRALAAEVALVDLDAPVEHTRVLAQGMTSMSLCFMSQAVL